MNNARQPSAEAGQSSRPKILVFDSGVGGLSVVDALAAAGLAARIDYLADHAWLPYGDKPDAALAARVPRLIAAADAALRPNLVVLACNTASTVALDAVRAVVTTPVVGVVPPVKPAAALTRTGVIGVLATPATIRRPYVDALIAEHAARVRVVKVGALGLVRTAEEALAGRAPDRDLIAREIAPLFAADPGPDVVALSCTHFPLLAPALRAAGPSGVTWLDSGEAVARRAAALLGLAERGETAPGWFFSTGLAEPPSGARARGFEPAPAALQAALGAEAAGTG